MSDTLRFDVPIHLFPVQHRFVDLEGARVHYVDEGEGDVLLMLHGNPTWSFLYRKMIAKPQGTFRCVAPDHPGFGLSESPKGYGFTPREHSVILERFVDELQLTKLTMIVQDWGGPIGLGLAGRRPELVKSLVIGNTWAWPFKGDRRMELFSWLMGGPIGQAMAYSFNGVVQYFMREGVVSRLDRDVLSLYLAPFQSRGNRKQTAISPRQLIRAAEYLSEVEGSLASVADRPVLLTWGARDFAFRQAERERFERLFPNHQTIVLENAGHFWQEDAADEASEAILDWAPQFGS